MKVMNDHRSKFSNLSSWKEKPAQRDSVWLHSSVGRAYEVMGSNPVEGYFSGFSFQLLKSENLLR